MKIILAAAGVLLMCLGSAIGIKCYVGQMSKYELKDCLGLTKQCAKITTNGLVTRSCFPSAVPFASGDGCKQASTTETCLCSKDACNGAATSYVSKMLAVILTAMTARVVM